MIAVSFYLKPASSTFLRGRRRWIPTSTLIQTRMMMVTRNSNSKLNTIKMARDDFVKSAYSCLLGASPITDAAPATKHDQVVLVKADSQLKKLLAVNDPKLFHNLKV